MKLTSAKIRLLIHKIFQVRLLDKYLQKKIFEKSTTCSFSGHKISHIRTHIYELSFRLTRDVRMSDFQFMINHDILNTKS